LALTGVAVEKGTKAVICVNFSACGKRRFNNLRANFLVKSREKSFSTPTGDYTHFKVGVFRLRNRRMIPMVRNATDHMGACTRYRDFQQLSVLVKQ
jgi:hypothetical protein